MRRFVLALALAAFAAVPGSGRAAAPATQDQEIARQIADTLMASGQMKTYSIAVKYKDGTARLEGWVRNPQQMNQALNIVHQMPQVKEVVNNLIIKQEPTVMRATPGKPAAFREAEQSLPISASVQPPVQNTASGSRYKAISDVQPAGDVAPQETASEVQPKTYVKKGLMGGAFMPAPVHTASNRPTVAKVQQTPPRPIQNIPAGQIQQPAEVPNVAAQQVPMGYGPQGQMVAARMMQPGMQPGLGAPLPAYVPGTGGGVAPAAYDQPTLPAYAWPSYAAYPNYAALTYPRQYSPTAWPYIGPFYPYPQVPLGWRKVTLEWDDGWWFLNFAEDRRHCTKW